MCVCVCVCVCMCVCVCVCVCVQVITSVHLRDWRTLFKKKKYFKMKNRVVNDVELTRCVMFQGYHIDKYVA